MTDARATTLDELIQHMHVLRDESPPHSSERINLNARLTALRGFALGNTENPSVLWGSLPLDEVLTRLSALSGTDGPEGMRKETFNTYLCRAIHTVREYLNLPVQRRRTWKKIGVHQSTALVDPVTSLLRLIGEHFNDIPLQIKLAEVLLTTLRQRLASQQPDLPSRV